MVKCLLHVCMLAHTNPKCKSVEMAWCAVMVTDYGQPLHCLVWHKMLWSDFFIVTTPTLVKNQRPFYFHANTSALESEIGETENNITKNIIADLRLCEFSFIIKGACMPLYIVCIKNKCSALSTTATISTKIYIIKYCYGQIRFDKYS